MNKLNKIENSDKIEKTDKIENHTKSQCLKITGKVAFNIASEASYVYIKMPKNGPFWRVFENIKLANKQSYQTGQF